MEYIKRSIEAEINKLSNQFPVIMLTGARQVGKSTTFMKLLSDKAKYVTLDNIDDRKLAIEDPKLFFEKYNYPLIIDEFQYAPQLLSYIKIIVDKIRFEKLSNSKINDTGLFYLTGSQRWITMENIQESLAGRVCILDMYGLSTREINKDDFREFTLDVNILKNEKTISKNKSVKEIYERIFLGSYPELYIKNIDREKFYESYVKTYISRDIRELIDIKDEIKFYNFLTIMASRTGCELNMLEIANEVGVSQVTIKQWINILVNSNILFLLKPFSKNIIKRVVKHPKLYFMDTGLVSYLLKYPSAEILENSNMSGKIFETYVVSEIIKSLSSSGKDIENLYFYRDNEKHEIDLVYHDGQKLYPIEIKKTKSIDKNFIKNFVYLESSNLEIQKGSVLCNVDEIYPIDNNNYAIPVRYI